MVSIARTAACKYEKNIGKTDLSEIERSYKIDLVAGVSDHFRLKSVCSATEAMTIKNIEVLHAAGLDVILS